MKNAFYRFINRLKKETISGPLGRVVETTQYEVQREKKTKQTKTKKTELPRMVGQHKTSNICVKGVTKRENKAEEIFEAVMSRKFPKLMMRKPREHQATD